MSEFGGLPENYWNSIHLCALVTIFFSVIGSSCIIASTVYFYSTARKEGRASELKLVRFFPLFISIGDLLYGFFRGCDHLIAFITHFPTSGSLCKISAYGYISSTNLIAMYVSICSIYLWYALGSFKTPPTMGKFAWKLHVPIFLFSFGPTLLPFFYRGYGSLGVYCGHKQEGFSRILSITFNCTLWVLCSLIITTIFYTWTSVVLRKGVRYMEDVSTFLPIDICKIVDNQTTLTPPNTYETNDFIEKKNVKKLGFNRGTGGAEVGIILYPSNEAIESDLGCTLSENIKVSDDNQLSLNEINFVDTSTSSPNEISVPSLLMTSKINRTREIEGQSHCRHQKKLNSTAKATIKLARRMNWFILIYIVQWLPQALVHLTRLESLIGFRVVLFSLIVILTNCGGVLNALAYILLLKGNKTEKSELE